MIFKQWLESGETVKRGLFTFIGISTLRVSRCIVRVTPSYRLLTTGTIEEKIFQRQILKQGLSGAVVDSRDSSKGHFTRDELKVSPIVVNLQNLT